MEDCTQAKYTSSDKTLEHPICAPEASLCYRFQERGCYTQHPTNVVDERCYLVRESIEKSGDDDVSENVEKGFSLIACSNRSVFMGVWYEK